MSSKELCGEPYALAGRRLVFSDYTFIRTAGFGWYDGKGKNIAVVGESGPFDTRFGARDVPYGIKIKAYPGHRSEAPFSIEAEYPWEADGINPGTVIHDPEDGLYKMWGTCSGGGNTHPCFLQSQDFKSWERPVLGLVDFGGSKENNLILSNGPLGNIFYDPSGKGGKWKWIAESTMTREELDGYLRKRDGEWDPKANRFDVLYDTHVGNPNLIVCVRGGVSEDGFVWRTLEEPLVVEHSDTIVTAYYDTLLQKYVGYFRDWSTLRCASSYNGPRKGLGWMAGRRSIGRAESDTFEHFPLSELIAEPGPEILSPSETIYTNGHTILPKTGNQHVFLPAIWDQANDATSVFVATSPDGRCLHWIEGSPVFETGSFGTYDGGCLFPGGDLLELPGGDWVMFYGASNVPHKYPRKGYCASCKGLMRWPGGRMIALESKEYGQFTTMSLIPGGRHIAVNADIARGGKLIAEVCDETGRAFPGYAFADCDEAVGDLFGAFISWKGNNTLPAGEGEPVMLRFRMSYARLFYIEFR